MESKRLLKIVTLMLSLLAAGILASEASAADVEARCVTLASQSASDTTDTLPTSVPSLTADQDYYVEVWASDVGTTNTGLTSVYVDLNFSPCAAISITSVDHAGIFTVFQSGTIGACGIDELGGSSLAGAGIEPQWARVAIVKIHAEAAGPLCCSLAQSTTGIAAFGRGIVPWSEVAFIVELTVSSTTGGSVTTPGEGTIQYNQGEDVSIVATAQAGYSFVNWTGTAVDAGKVLDPSAASTTVTVDADYTLQANFASSLYTLTISSTGGGSVTIPGEGPFQYAPGTPVPISATAQAGYTFVSWTGTAVDAAKVAEPDEESTIVTVDGDYSLQANFVPTAGPKPMGTAFTYQGRLTDDDSLADGLYDFQFKLYDDPNVLLGNQVGDTIDVDDLDVVGGYFAVALDFDGGAFNGDARWLDISVRPGASTGSFTVLSPRQEVTPAPYALHSRGVFVDDDGNVGIGTKSPQGKLDVNGAIYQRGSQLHADYVFGSNYTLESIDEHSEFMWQNKHLQAIPKAKTDENGNQIVEVGAHRKGVVEELEKAHIYIEQLHKRIKALEEKLRKLQESTNTAQ